MDYTAQIFGFGKSQRKQIAEQLLSRVYLDEKSWDKQLRKFSKGMLQRDGLAQALINDPEVIFLDEPMSGLDPVGRRQVRDLIAELKTEGKTVFMCSHILSDIEVLCDRVAIMRQGRLAASGRLEELRGAADADGQMEITVSGVDIEALAPLMSDITGASISTTPGGARVSVQSERDIDQVLIQVRRMNGRLISVQPVRQSLEELFVKETQPR